jgi:Transposase, Mutator family
MALDQSALLELLEVLKVADADDVVRRAVESVFQALIDAEATARIGAAPHERSQTRVTQRNGFRDRLVSTAAGDVELGIPKLRAGSFFPSLLERRRRIDQALFAVVMESDNVCLRLAYGGSRFGTQSWRSDPGAGSRRGCPHNSPNCFASCWGCWTRLVSREPWDRVGYHRLEPSTDGRRRPTTWAKTQSARP